MRVPFRTAVRLGPRAAALGDGGPAAAAARLDALEAVDVLARSRTTDACVVEVPGLGRAVRKRWSWPRGRDRAKGAFRTTFGAASPARREFAALTRLRALPGGPFAPEPYGWTERRRGAVLHACALLLEEIPGARDLARFLAAERAASRRAAVLADLAARVREMHDAGLVDGDLHPRNVLVAGGRTWKVDGPKQRALAGRAPLAARIRDLAALDVGLVRLASAAEREAFVAAATGMPFATALRARLDAERARLDARESRRLPPTALPPGAPGDNDR